jgi:CHAT domain-containing protein
MMPFLTKKLTFCLLLMVFALVVKAQNQLTSILTPEMEVAEKNVLDAKKDSLHPVQYANSLAALSAVYEALGKQLIKYLSDQASIKPTEASNKYLLTLSQDIDKLNKFSELLLERTVGEDDKQWDIVSRKQLFVTNLLAENGIKATFATFLLKAWSNPLLNNRYLRYELSSYAHKLFPPIDQSIKSVLDVAFQYEWVIDTSKIEQEQFTKHLNYTLLSYFAYSTDLKSSKKNAEAIEVLKNSLKQTVLFEERIKHNNKIANELLIVLHLFQIKANNSIGVAYYQMGEMSLGIHHAKIVVELCRLYNLDMDKLEYTIHLAQYLFYEGQCKEAIMILRKALNTFSKTPAKHIEILKKLVEFEETYESNRIAHEAIQIAQSVQLPEEDYVFFYERLLDNFTKTTHVDSMSFYENKLKAIFSKMQDTIRSKYELLNVSIQTIPVTFEGNYYFTMVFLDMAFTRLALLEERNEADKGFKIKLYIKFYETYAFTLFAFGQTIKAAKYRQLAYDLIMKNRHHNSKIDNGIANVKLGESYLRNNDLLKAKLYVKLGRDILFNIQHATAQKWLAVAYSQLATIANKEGNYFVADSLFKLHFNYHDYLGLQISSKTAISYAHNLRQMGKFQEAYKVSISKIFTNPDSSVWLNHESVDEYGLRIALTALIFTEEDVIIMANNLCNHLKWHLYFNFNYEFELDEDRLAFMSALNETYDLVCSSLTRTGVKGAAVFYDLLLLQKGIVLTNTQNFKSKAQKLTDSTDIKNATQLEKVWKTLDRRELEPHIKLKMEALDLKNSLSKKSPELFKADWTKITWRDVQKQLKESEVAIEIIDFQYHTPTVPSDSIMYYAAVLRKGDAQPTMIRLFEEKQLLKYLQRSPYVKDEQHVENLYITHSAELYDLIWKPFEKAGLLKQGNTVYVSASGQLNRVALGALINAERSTRTKDTLFRDLYRLEMVNSTRDIWVEATDKVLKINDLSALLVGGVRYESDSTAVIQAFQQQQALLNNPKELMVVRSLTPDIDSCNLNYLAGSLTEVQAIHAAIQTQKRVDATLLTGFSASEDNVRAQLKSAPTMLHLSTHGGYTLPEQRKLTPMQALHNNFVLLSGCERVTCQGKPNIEGMDDGVLTAAEVADMDLKKTQLVVLAACETGLGDLRGREGVFGLARGFKLAGAKYQLVSLWQVPDAETAAFMQLFYQKCLNGTAIQDAFLETQAVLRTQYPDAPYKWAAWVLIR